MDKSAFTKQKMLDMANIFAKFTRRKIGFKDYSEVTVENAGVSIVRSCLYCINVMDSDIFEIHKYRSETEKLLVQVTSYAQSLDGHFSLLSQQLDETKIQIESLLETADQLSFQKAKSKPKNMRSRYIAAIVANCYFDKFEKWPKTARDKPKASYLRATTDICKILNKRDLYAISASCEDFCLHSWQLWEETPPLLVGKLKPQ